MQTPSIRLIPADYLERVKGNVSTRQDLAREANLPKVVLDRLVCDRSKSVREYAAKNPGLDAEQVQHLLDDSDYNVIYELNRNHKLSHELVVLQLQHRFGVRDNTIFRNPNIKASEFAELVKEYLRKSGASTWSIRNVCQQAACNKGVGNGAVIALTEMAYSEGGASAYENVLEYALTNESLSGRSIQYLIERAKRKLKSVTSIIKRAISHPKVSNSFIDSVVIDSIEAGENVLRAFDFSENYVASEKVVEAVLAAYPNHNNNSHLEFLVKHVPRERLTPERIAMIELTNDAETAADLLLKGVELSEGSMDRLTMVVAMSSENECIDLLVENLYIKSHHIDEMASSSSWSTRRRAARLHNISDETLKKLATDSDSDVRQAVRENPKWEIVRDSVEAQEAAYRFSEKVNTLSKHAEEMQTGLLEKYSEEYGSIRHVIDAIRVLADPKTKEAMRAFKVEESRNLMKDGIDLDTLTLLEDFF